MKRSLILSMFLLFTMFSAKAQWQPANGAGGTVTCFASCPDGSGGTNIFAGTTNGVIKSTDNGLTWTSASKGITCMSIHALAVSQNGTGGYNIFAGTGVISGSGLAYKVNGGVFISTDGGTNWSDAGLDTIFVTSLAAYPNSTNDCNIFAGAGFGSRHHLFSSTNNGLTWNSIGSDSIAVWSLNSYPNGAGGYSLYAGSGIYTQVGSVVETIGGVYRSTDNGKSWDSLLAGDVNCIAVKDSDIYAGTILGLYHSSNNGASWNPDTITLNGFHLPNQFIGGTSITSIAAIPDGKGGTILFAGINAKSGSVSVSALVRSTDNGVTWSCPISWSSSVSAVPNGAGGFNIFAGGQKLLRSTDNGATWLTTNIGMSDADIHFLTTVPNSSGGTDLITSYYPNFLLRSTNDGATWFDIDTSGLASGFVSPYGGAFTTMPNKSGGVNFYVACYGKLINLFNLSTIVKFYESTNNGSSWNSLNGINTNILDYDGTLSMASAPNRIGGYNIFESGESTPNMLSTDNGSTWQTPKESFQAYTYVVDDSITYALNGGINFSTDGGLTWARTNSPGYLVWSFAAKGKYLLAGTPNNGVYLSTDSGTTWNAVNNGALSSVISNSGISSVGIVPDGNGSYKFLVCTFPLYQGIPGRNNYIFLSTNFGVTWSDVSDGLPLDGAIINLVEKNDRNGIPYIYAGFGAPLSAPYSFGYHGIWRRPLSELVVDVKESLNQTPTRFSLGQNYPNPFNPSTTISYSIPQRSYVTLKVYDMLGKEVSVLVNEEKNAGSYIIKFNGSTLSSGIYFYKLQAGNFTQTKKLILLK